MTYNILRSIIILIIVSSCSTVSNQATKPNPSSAKLDRVLIIAMSKQYETRSMYEQELSYKLRELGYSIFSSVNVDKNKKDLYTREELLELIKEKNIGGVIALRLKDISSKERYTQSTRFMADSQHNYFFNYIDSYYGVYNWSYQQEKTVVVETSLFDADDKTMIFQIDSTIKNAENDEERADELTKSIAKSLGKSGLLKKKAK